MKLYMSPRAPNPKRVCMFIAEKGLDSIQSIAVDLNAGAHREQDFLSRNPLARVPVLELDDGRFISESRAICTWPRRLSATQSDAGGVGRACIYRNV